MEGILHSTTLAIPVLFLLVVGLGLMLFDSFKVKSVLPWLAGLGFIGSAALAYMAPPAESTIAFNMLETGGIAPMVHAFLCLSGLFTLFFLPDYLNRQEKPISDVYALLVFSVIGMILMANATNLLMIFIGLETMSICLYIFAALFKKDERSNEAGLKYFLLGAFASAFLLFGISLLYGLTGSTNLDIIASKGNELAANSAIFYASAGLILVGFLFKVSAFPFHNWTPDVYTGTPTPLAGFMATGSKMASFIALGIVMMKMNFVGEDKIFYLVAIVALFTMVYGNIVAARQTNLKRMLAYSSIAHTGYVLLGLCAGAEGFTAVIFYMFIYTLMNIGAFGLVGMAEKQFEDTDNVNWKGMGFKAPYLAIGLSIFLLSLAGIPPLAGFMGKYQVFISAIRAEIIWLAVIGILTSVIGAYYYIGIISVMFFGKDEKSELETTSNMLPLTGAAILVVLILLFGLYPSLILGPIDAAFDSVYSTTTTVMR